MKISTKNKINTSFNMVSMTDVVFLLVIFLLVTSNYTPKAIPVDLPLSKNEKVSLAEVSLSVTKTLQYYVDGQLVPFDQLEDVLRVQLDKKSSKIVVLHMDKVLSIADMVKVADIAAGLGAEVSIATQFEKRS